MRFPHGVIMNQPIKICWAGWETDTFRLSKEGWEISAEQMSMHHEIRLAINHPKLRVQGITHIAEWVFEDILRNSRHAIIPTSLIMQSMDQVLYVQTMGRTNSFDFHPIDANPTYIERMISPLSEIAHFQRLEREVPRHEIFLHEANINQILEMALKIQEPDQERIRKDLIHRKNMESLRMGKLHTELRIAA